MEVMEEGFPLYPWGTIPSTMPTTTPISTPIWGLYQGVCGQQITTSWEVSRWSAYAPHMGPL